MQHNIAQVQTKPEMVRLLWARDRTYQLAKTTQGWFVLGTALVPVIGAATAASFPGLKPILAFISLVLLLLDVGLLDRMQKDRLKRGAKLQEEFDTKAFELPWNKFVAGDKVPPEDVTEAASQSMPAERKKQFESWYEACVTRVPMRFARLVCQRTNISYDARLRRRYGNGLLGTVIAVSVAILIICIVLAPAFDEAVLSMAIVAPLLSWALKEHRKQLDTAAALHNLQSEFKTLWGKALAGASDEEVTSGSRQLQDAIYQHRASAPLVFDWVYCRMRDKNEKEAADAAEEFVREAEQAFARRPA